MRGARFRQAITPLLLLLALFAAPARAHDPHDVIARLAISPAFPQDGTLVAVCLLDDTMLFGRSRDAGRTWQIYGLPMITDEVTWLAFSPGFATDQTIFASTGNGGVWRSSDGGTTFVRINDGLSDLRVRRIAVSPAFATDHLLLATTNSGCFRSVDGGEHWALANDGIVDKQLSAVAFEPGAGGEGTGPAAFVAGKVVERSDDGGQTWTALKVFTGPACSLAVSPNYRKDGTLAACFGRFGGGVQVSHDRGATFGPMVGGLTDQFVNDLAIASNGTMFGVTQTVGCFRATAPGAQWVPLVRGLEPIASKQASSHFEVVDLSPAFASDHKLFVASFEGLYHSDDAGDSWQESDVFSQMLSERVAFSPDYARDHALMLGNFGAGPLVWIGGDPAARVKDGSPAAAGAKEPWAARASGISSLYTNELVLSPAYATDKTLFDAYVGTWRSTDEGRHWTRLTTPLNITRTMALSPGFATDRTVFAGSYDDGVARSLDAGDHWDALTTGLPQGIAVVKLATSPAYAHDHTVFLSSTNDGLYRSTDGGDSWKKAGAGIPTENVRTLCVSPDFAKDHTIFAGAVDPGVFVSHDAGSSWAASNAGLPADVPLIVESIAASPGFAADRTLFVSLLNDGVFRSTDGGSNWVRASSGLPVTASRSLQVSPDFAHDHTLLLSTYDWAWISIDAGNAWERLPGYIRVDDTHPAVVSTGTWMAQKGEGCQGFGCQSSKAPGDSVQLEFRGRSIGWFSRLGPAEGTAEIILDAKSLGLVNLASAQLAPEARGFTRTFPAVGWHTIRIVNAGAQPGNPSTTIATDGFEYDF